MYGWLVLIIKLISIRIFRLSLPIWPFRIQVGDHYTGVFPDDSSQAEIHISNPPYGLSDVSTSNVGLQLNHKLLDFLIPGTNVLTFGSEYLYDAVYDEIPAYNYLIEQNTHDLGLFFHGIGHCCQI